MKAQEEYEALKARQLEADLQPSRDLFTCVMAVAATDDVKQADSDIPEDLLIHGGSSVVVGTLDVVVARALEGEALIGSETHAAYMANVCTAGIARRRGVARSLLESARHIARDAGVAALYVHLMAVNEAGRAMYESCGFQLEKEESANQAHYRGHCLDGVEGLGRTILMRDAQL